MLILLVIRESADFEACKDLKMNKAELKDNQKATLQGLEP